MAATEPDLAASKLARLRELRAQLSQVDRAAIMAERLVLFDELHDLGVRDDVVGEAWGTSGNAIKVARHQRR